MVEGKNVYQLLTSVSRYLTLTLVAVIFVTPILWMLSASFMERSAVTASPVNLLPPIWRPENYTEIFTRFDLGRYFGNSLFVTGTVVLSNLFFCALTGYSLAKFRYPGRGLIFTFILATMMVPFNVILIPLYLLVRSFGWVDTYQGLILPYAMTAFGIFLMRQFIVSIPDDYIAAARVDGASELRIFVQIILPLSRPALITLAILTFVANWDEFLWTLIIIPSAEKRTLPLGLAQFLQQYGNEWHLLMAAAVVAALPVIVLFLALQKPFLNSLGGLSGLKE
jgi:multiple sugar transport system permease protein